jgi:hypothetical protein
MRPSGPDPVVVRSEIRHHRIYYEVYAEKAIGVKGRPVVAIEVRLWAVLEKLGPRSEATRAAATALASVAGAADAGDGGADLEPFRSALYDSKQVPGADEIYVALALRLRGDGAEAERDRDRRLVALRQRLERLGIFAGRWKELPPRPAEAPDAWEIRGASGALPKAA